MPVTPSYSLQVSAAYGYVEEGRHFIVRAAGHSMDGGKNPIRDGDHLLMEWVNPSSAGSITGSVMAIERQDTGGDDQYLLRSILKRPDGSYLLRANNPSFKDMDASDEFRTLAFGSRAGMAEATSHEGA